MAGLKYSRQRELIKKFVAYCDGHPTADDVYQEVRKQHPNISLGTVYRNLTLLCEQGEIKRIVSTGPDRFDGILVEHDHFICEECGDILNIPKIHLLDIDEFRQGIPGKVSQSKVYYYGICENCQKSN